MARPYKLDINKPENIEVRINDYFELCADKNEIPLFPGLLLHLDISRPAWYKYTEPLDIDNNKYNTDVKYRNTIDNKRRVCDILKKAELRLEESMSAEAMRTGKAAAIFMLKQKFYGGYQDKQINEISGDVPINVVIKGSGGKEFKE